MTVIALLFNTTIQSRRNPSPHLHPDKGRMSPVPGLPTELWGIIIRMATHFPLDFDFTSDHPREGTTALYFKQTMATKLSLMLVSRRFNAIVSEFLFEFVYISTVRLAASIKSQETWDRKRLGTWQRYGWRKALRMELYLGSHSPVPTRPTNVLDLSRRADVNIRYLFVEERGGCRLSNYTVTVADFLRSDCCRNLGGFFIAGDEADPSAFADTVIDAIPSGLKLLSWNAPANGDQISTLLARFSGSLERLRIRPSIMGTSGINLPKVTHFALAGAERRGRGRDLQYLGGWNMCMPALTHLTFGFGPSDEPGGAVQPSPLFENVEYLQLHLRSRNSTTSTQVPHEPTTIAAPHPTMQAIVITCHDLEDRVAITPTLVQGVLQICDRNRFPKLKSLDVFGVSSCTWWLTGAEEVEMLLRKVSERLAMPDVAVRVMS